MKNDCRICCVPARAHRDQLAGDMLVQLLWQQECPARSTAATMPLAELVGWIREADVEVVCISVVPPSTLIHARYRCSKLRAEFPNLKIIVGLWGHSKLAPETIVTLQNSGADEIVTTLTEAVGRMAVHAENGRC